MMAFTGQSMMAIGALTGSFTIAAAAAITNGTRVLATIFAVMRPAMVRSIAQSMAAGTRCKGAICLISRAVAGKMGMVGRSSPATIAAIATIIDLPRLSPST